MPQIMGVIKLKMNMIFVYYGYIFIRVIFCCRFYRNLPEVKKKRDEERKAAFLQTNRLKAKLYGKVGEICLFFTSVVPF